MATKAAMLRLQREIVELEKEPLEGVQYHFRDSDMKHMCLILTPQSGPFRGLRLHLKVRIPDNYPRDPPVVTIQTNVDHPNVMGGGFICCDILAPRNQWAMDSMRYNGGYTPAYLLKYIFYQLLSFFSVYEVDQDTGGTKKVISYRYHSVSHFQEAAVKQVRGYVCSACGFNISIPSTVDAASMDVDKPSPSPEEESSPETRFCYLSKLDTDCWLSILDKLSDQDMHSLARAWAPVKQLQQNLLIRRQLVCFYLRKTHLESVLGIGLRVSDEVRSTAQGRPHSGFVGRAASIRMLDLLSLEAYTEHGVRTGIYGEEFNVFLPIAIDPSHFTRAETILRDSLFHIHRMWVRPEKMAGWPLCIVEVLPRLMNHMVLELVKDCDTQLQNTGRGLWTVKRSSEKALQGYCLLLDLFEKLAKRFPEVERELRSRVSLFRQSQGARHKSRTPDLGMFLTYLLVLKEDWSSHCVSFVKEFLARNVVWYLDGSKSGNRSLAHLAHLEDDSYVSVLRLRETFAASSRSLKLFMFQVSFLRLVSRGIDSHYGYPSPEDSRNMFQQTQEIYAVQDWDDCLRICEYQLPESARQNWQPHVCKMLKMAVSHSQTAKYHVVPCSKHQLYYWRSLAEPTCPTPSWWDFGDPYRYSLHNLRPGALSFFPRHQ